MPTIGDAIKLAVDAHERQIDKGGQPYILHPLRLMLAVNSEPARIVALLHDVIEDNPTFTLEKLRLAGYPQDVLDALDCLTKRPSEHYSDFIDRIKPNVLARKVKLADLRDNMDVTRLPKVTSDDLERLQRYRDAWPTLTAPVSWSILNI